MSAPSDTKTLFEPQNSFIPIRFDEDDILKLDKKAGREVRKKGRVEEHVTALLYGPYGGNMSVSVAGMIVAAEHMGEIVECCSACFASALTEQSRLQFELDVEDLAAVLQAAGHSGGARPTARLGTQAMASAAGPSVRPCC